VGSEVDTIEYEHYLKTLSENRENILFLGERTGETLEQLFSHAALFVQPSEEEGLSIALLEAMGHGLPVIVSDIPANLEAVGVVATTFLSGDSEDLRKKMAYLINRPQERTQMGHDGEERVRNQYSWDAVTQQTLAIYAEELWTREHHRAKQTVPTTIK
jgi:glycosyltransferase involved in cell wall biosynthesis